MSDEKVVDLKEARAAYTLREMVQVIVRLAPEPDRPLTKRVVEDVFDQFLTPILDFFNTLLQAEEIDAIAVRDNLTRMLLEMSAEIVNLRVAAEKASPSSRLKP